MFENVKAWQDCTHSLECSARCVLQNTLCPIHLPNLSRPPMILNKIQWEGTYGVSLRQKARNGHEKPCDKQQVIFLLAGRPKLLHIREYINTGWTNMGMSCNMLHPLQNMR